MMKFKYAGLLILLLCLFSGLSSSGAQQRPQQLLWDSKRQLVSAEIDSMPLSKFLEQLSAVTGWTVFVEPGTSHTVSAKFKERPPGDALRLLLGNLSFALLPQTNGAPKFFVFKTSIEQATQYIQPLPQTTLNDDSKPIPDELIVRLKAGQKPDDIFKGLKAKIIGVSDSLNAYRLKFESEADAKAARELLKNNPAVVSVEDNYLLRKPTDLEGLLLGYTPSSSVKVQNANPKQGIVIGLIDTAVQKSGSAVDSFLLPIVPIAGEVTPPENEPTHGTAMAETILRGLSAALKDDAAANLQILPIDVYGKNDSTTTFEVALSINAAIEKNVQIINLSLGGNGDSPFLYELIKKARENGILIFAAAGNNPDGTPIYPAAYPEVIAVTSGDRNGNIAPYANRGDFVDVVAPGTSIITYRGQAYLVSGTSASTAFTTGIAAAIALQEGKTAADLEKIIRSTLPTIRQTTPAR